MLSAACSDESPPPPGEDVDCAIGAGAEFSRACTVELIAAENEIVLHHPDGGFRRLTHDRATGALAPLDGAEPLTMQQRNAEAVQFAIGQDRYRVPLSLLSPPPQ